MRSRAPLVLAMVAAGCGHRPAPPPAAPHHVPVMPRGETLAYARDAFVGRWKLMMDVQASPDSTTPLKLMANVEARFEADGPGALRLFLVRMSTHGELGSAPTDTVLDGSDPATRAFFDRPLDTVVLSPTGPGQPERGEAPPEVNPARDVVRSLVFLIPILPDAPVAPGATWSAPRVLPTTTGVGPTLVVDVRYRFERLEPCAEGTTARCALVRFTADTGDAEYAMNGQPVRYRYGFEGRSLVRLGGAVVESDATLTFRIALGGQVLAGTGVLAMSPR